MTIDVADDPRAAPPPRGIFAGHADQHRPLGSYGALMGLFSGAFGTGLLVAGRSGRLPERIGARDVALLGVATFRLSRLIARDRVTSVVRAPFTRFQDDAGHGEVDEAARGVGLRRAVGELLICDFCLAPWVAAPGVVGLALAPRATRAVATLFAVQAVADALQLAYTRALERS